MTVMIDGSVGAVGKNGKADTRKIQKLLNSVFPSTPLVVDGDCGSKTIRRIKRFQKRFMAAPDGRVDPKGRTLKKLNAAAPGLQNDWSGDSSRWSEEKKLASLDRRMRPKVVRVLAALKAQEFKPKIFLPGALLPSSRKSMRKEILRYASVSITLRRKMERRTPMRWTSLIDVGRGAKRRRKTAFGKHWARPEKRKVFIGEEIGAASKTGRICNSTPTANLPR